jgi:hypothetical protein
LAIERMEGFSPHRKRAVDSARKPRSARRASNGAVNRAEGREIDGVAERRNYQK